MTKEQAFIELQQIFRTVFKTSKLEIDYSTTMDDVESWDSLSHVVLIDTVEKHFNIKFELRDMLNIESVDDICNSVIAKSKI